MYEFKTSVVFKANYESRADIVINQGGTDSGKTYAILQVLITLATTTNAPKEDPVISVVSESVPNAKKGSWRTMQGILQTPGLDYYIKNVHEGDRIVYFRTGWIMEFIGAVDQQNAKQGKRQYLFCNEANGLDWMVFWEYAKRTRIRTWIDYNPTAPFWAHDKLINTTPDTNDLGATVQLIRSWHEHNVFLSEAEHRKTEAIKDPELFRVYARGLTGNLQGLIYPNWKMIPDADYPNEDGKFGGLDFGYTNDPTAAVAMVKIANKVYVKELCYDNAMTPRMLKTLFRSNGFNSETPIYCDHDADMIKQLRLLEVGAQAAMKGPNSIKAGIQKVGEYEIYYTASSTNIEFERRRYMWQKDKSTGRLINEPTELDNHLMDAIRYGVYTKFYRRS